MRTTFVLSLVWASVVSAQDPPAQLVGRILNNSSRDGVSGAAVTLSNGARTISDKRGWFTFSNLPAGRIGIAVEMLGYQPRSDSITVQAGRHHDLEIRLTTKAIELPPMTITVRSRWLEENGFYDRRTSGLTGRVITAADIERKGRSQLTEVLGEMPSVRVYNAPSSNPTVRKIVRFMSGAGNERARRSRVPGCEPALFIDASATRTG